MGFIVTNEWLFIPLVAICVFIVAYFSSDAIIAWLYKRSLGQREDVIRLLDLMFVEIDRKRITWVLLLASFGFGVIFFVLLWPNIWLGLFVGSIITIVGWSVPKSIVNSLYERRCNLFVDQMVDGMTIMSNGVKSGLSLTQAMERVTENLKAPISQEFGLVLSQVRIGRSIEEALNELSERVPKPDVQMFVNSINILKETGGNLAETFATITVTIRERQKVEKKIQALTAQGLMQGVIITLVPFFLMGVFLVIDPNYIKPLFNTTLGIILLIVMLTLQIIGGVMIRRLVKIDV